MADVVQTFCKSVFKLSLNAGLVFIDYEELDVRKGKLCVDYNKLLYFYDISIVRYIIHVKAESLRAWQFRAVSWIIPIAKLPR